MKRKELLAIVEQFSEYDVRFSDAGESFEIINPFGKEPIRVFVENDPQTPYMVCFSFQHRHLATTDEAIAYTGDILGGNVFAIEFFKDGRNRFGCDLNAQELRDLSYTALAQRMGCYGDTKLIDYADSFKVRGWGEDTDFDAVFVTDEQGYMTIQKCT